MEAKTLCDLALLCVGILIVAATLGTLTVGGLWLLTGLREFGEGRKER